jgi:superfamily II DNA or RNA helicase
MTKRDIEQEKAIQAIRNDLARNQKALCVACTGYGKGELIRKIAEKMSGTLLVVVPKVNLVSDIAERIGDCSIYCASLGKKEIGKITVGTIQSLRKIANKSDVLIIDEAHNFKDELIESFDSKFKIGFTATDFDQRGFIHGEDRFWNKPCYKFTIGEAIDAGFLCDYKLVGSHLKFDLKTVPRSTTRDFTISELNHLVNNGKAFNQVQEFMSLTKDKKKIVILCVSIEHAENIQALIQEYEPCEIIHSKLKDNQERLARYKVNDIRFCTSVLMISEGYDQPSLDALIILRPTRSPRLMIQACGRVLRLFTGKTRALILDYGDVFLNCGTPKKPKFNFLKLKKGEPTEQIIKECEECHCIYEAQFNTCPDCGHTNVVIREPEKNLNDSIVDQKLETIYLNKDDFSIAKKTTKGAKFCVYRKSKMAFNFFGGNYFKAIRKKPMKVTFRMKGKFPSVVAVDILG